MAGITLSDPLRAEYQRLFDTSNAFREATGRYLDGDPRS
jgi:hypothetical protein